MIILTGSSGLIGSAICKGFIDKNFDFIPIYYSNKPKYIQAGEKLDLRLFSNCEKLTKYKIETIIHLAAFVPDVLENADNSNLLIDSNIRKIQTITKANVIYFSGCSLYKTADHYCDEYSEIEAQNLYHKTKIDGEKLFLSSGKATIVRVSSPIGIIGNKNNVFSKFVSSAIQGRNLEIWGSGNREQDFIDTLDIFDLVIKILEKPKFGIYNLCSSNPITMLDLAKKTVETIKKGNIIFSQNNDPLDFQKNRFSNLKAKQDYSWIPKRTVIDSIRRVYSEGKI